MALFSSAEADACTIVRMELKQKNGSFYGWVIGVEDAEGNYYDWTDNSTAVGATKSVMKANIKSYLEDNVEKITTTKPTYTVAEETEKGLGETIG